jgi:hypothetical protein
MVRGGLLQLLTCGVGGSAQELTGNTSNACPYNINNSMNQYFFEYPRGQLNNKAVLDKSVLNKENIIERISSDENELKYKEEMKLKYKNEHEFKQDELKYKEMSEMERISSDENELKYKEEIRFKYKKEYRED